MTVTISAHPCATNTLTAAQEVERRGCVDDRVELAGNTPRGGQRSHGSNPHLVTPPHSIIRRSHGHRSYPRDGGHQVVTQRGSGVLRHFHMNPLNPTLYLAADILS